MNQKFEVGVTRTLKAVEQEQALAADRAEAARPAVTIIQRSPLAPAGERVTPRPRPIPAPTDPRPVVPNESVPAPGRRRWKIGRAEIAAIIAVALIVILLLTQL
jgi:hypothetical protein